MSIDLQTRRLITRAKRAAPLSAEEELACVAAWQERQDRVLAGRLIAAHLRHVVFTAMKFQNYGIPVADLISEGSVGLMKALDRFDAGKGVRFSTYAIYWIRAHIVMEVMNSWSVLSGPRGALNSRVFFRLRRERARLGSNEDAQSVLERLAAQFGVKERRMAEMLNQLDQRGTSLDTPQPGSAHSLYEELSGEHDQDQEALLEQSEQRQKLAGIIERARAALDRRELFILERRLIADPEEKLSLSEIGAHFGVSRERVRQLELRACAKLRNQLLMADAALETRAA
jgi:RNA polymerase sigma-32 factor